MMTLRIWAVWGRKHYVTAVLVAVFAGCFIPVFIFIGKYLAGITYIHRPFPIPSLGVCLLMGGDHHLYLVWTIIMIYDTITFVLMMIPLERAYRTGGKFGMVKIIYQNGQSRRREARFGSSPSAIGIKYFAVMFLSSMVNIIVIATRPDLVYLLTPYVEYATTYALAD
ncbi:hypothetical protein PM082_024179 [Marasmius tenuissimus]|nr:hypothetical protein PM082_024179 [Marasmius tenuissimus]